MLFFCTHLAFLPFFPLFFVRIATFCSRYMPVITFMSSSAVSVLLLCTLFSPLLKFFFIFLMCFAHFCNAMF